MKLESKGRAITLSERMGPIVPSSTLVITAKAKALKAEGHPVISLAAGEPDFPTPPIVRQAINDALEGGFTKYTPTSGYSGVGARRAPLSCTPRGGPLPRGSVLRRSSNDFRRSRKSFREFYRLARRQVSALEARIVRPITVDAEQCPRPKGYLFALDDRAADGYRVDVLPDGVTCRRQLEYGAIRTDVDERVAVWKPLRARVEPSREAGWTGVSPSRC